MLEEEIVAYLEVSGSTFKIRKMNVDTKIWGGEFLRGKGSKLIRLQYIKEWTVLYQNWTVDVITLTEYTSQVGNFYLHNSSRDHKKTNFNCQI
jgi:hypothetical protein